MSTMRDLDSCHALSQVNCKCTWQLQISFRIRFTFLSNVGLVQQIVPLSCSLSSQTSLSLFFFYRPEKYLKSLCRPCSLQSAGDQEPRPQNVHHVDKLTQSASSRSISPSPLWNPTLLMVHQSVSGEGKEKVEEASSSLAMTEWEGRSRRTVWCVKYYACVCVLLSVWKPFIVSEISERWGDEGISYLCVY